LTDYGKNDLSKNQEVSQFAVKKPTIQTPEGNVKPGLYIQFLLKHRHFISRFN
jgi:hypothetical protein